MYRNLKRRMKVIAAAGAVALGTSACSGLPHELETGTSASFTCTQKLGTSSCFDTAASKRPGIDVEFGPRVMLTDDIREPAYGYGVTIRYNIFN